MITNLCKLGNADDFYMLPQAVLNNAINA